MEAVAVLGEGLLAQSGQQLVPHGVEHLLQLHRAALDDHHRVLGLQHNAVLAVGAVPPEDAWLVAAPELVAVARVPVGVALPAGAQVLNVLGGGLLKPGGVQQLLALPAALVGHKLGEAGHGLQGEVHPGAAHFGAVGQGLAKDLAHLQGVKEPGL